MRRSANPASDDGEFKRVLISHFALNAAFRKCTAAIEAISERQFLAGLVGQNRRLSQGSRIAANVSEEPKIYGQISGRYGLRSMSRSSKRIRIFDQL